MMSTFTVERDPGLMAAWAAYEDAGRPREACPCCGYWKGLRLPGCAGYWKGLRLPGCADAGWMHYESCARIRYSGDLCDDCRAEAGGRHGQG